MAEYTDFTTGQVIEVITQLCQVLAFIHSRLYIHRDLKPDNIKYLDDGTIKLLDYGLISQLGVTSSKQISGTYYYLATEVITGGKNPGLGSHSLRGPMRSGKLARSLRFFRGPVLRDD